jgi:hypothetical protein
MRTGMIKNYVDQLKKSFGKIRVPVDDAELQSHFNAKDYTQMLAFICKSMNVLCRLRLGMVNSGGASAPAWVELPEHFPMPGTKQFSELLVTMYLRKDFVARAEFEAVVLALAHETAHIVLDSVRHTLRREEPAVDLTAMLLGYRDFYVTGCKYQTVSLEIEDTGLGKVFNKLWGKISGTEVTTTGQIGYLSREEVIFASNYMTLG